MKILISNDDGVYSAGIRQLKKHLEQIAEVTVVAPDRNRSGASNSLTLDNPLRIKTIEPDIISVEGTPTDCVHVALTGILSEDPDMVVSGINHGANLGDDVWYSGTVAAAIEGRFLGLPAIALSMASDHPQHLDTAGLVAIKLIQQLNLDPLPAATILNVNIPDIPINQLQGFAVTRLGTRHRAEKIVPATDPRGFPIYWIGPAGSQADAGEGTDFHAINQHLVSITPLQIDLTQYQAFEQLSQWVLGLNA